MRPKRVRNRFLQRFVDSHIRGSISDMSLFTIALIVLGLLFVQGVGLYFILRRRETPAEEGSGMVLLQQQMQELARTLNAQVSESSRAMQENAHRQFSE